MGMRTTKSAVGFIGQAGVSLVMGIAVLAGCASVGEAVHATSPASRPEEASVVDPMASPGSTMHSETVDPQVQGVMLHCLCTASNVLQDTQQGGLAVRVIGFIVTAELGGVMLSQSVGSLTVPTSSNTPVSVTVSNLDTSLAQMSAEFLLFGKVTTTDPSPPFPNLVIRVAPQGGKTWGQVLADADFSVAFSPSGG